MLFRTVFSGSSKMAETARTLSFDAFSWAAGLKRNGFFPDLDGISDEVFEMLDFAGIG